MEPQTQKRALLVDDEPLARMVARKGLEGAGCYVSEADSCAQAEAQWRSQVFDLVVLDHRLDDGLGMDVLARMRAEGRQEPVIYLSAEAQEEMTEDRRRDLRVHAVLGKPLNLEALALAVASAGLAPETAVPAPQAVRHGRFMVVEGPAEWTIPAVEALRKAHGGV